jgi:hypothetical protein
MKRALVSLLGFAALASVGWMLLTSLAPGAWIASWAPCPRNWGWTSAWLPRASPLASEPIRFSRGQAKICYGRPSLRGRTMLGGDAVPFGRLWRTGANEPTTLHLNVPAEMGELFLEPGSYALYTVPRAHQWEVVVNRSTRQWGLESLYDETLESQEVGRFRLPVETLASPVETLTIRPVPMGGDFWTLQLAWERSRIRIPLRAVSRSRLGEEPVEELPPLDDGLD